MDNPLVLPNDPHSLALTDKGIPALFVHAGDQAAYRFIEFFTANIHNPNPRMAYYRAVTRFSRWCERYGVELTKVNPVLVAKYVQELGAEVQAPSVKQHLAAIRMLFDHLVTGQIVPLNPAAAVKGPKYVIKV